MKLQRKWIKLFYVSAVLALILLFWDNLLPVDLFGTATVILLGREFKLAQVISTVGALLLMGFAYWIISVKLCCPHCGRSGVDPRYKKGKPQKCPYCGEILLFDEEA